MRVYILNIETSTKACSVALHKNGELIVSREDVTTNFSHSEKLLKFISKLFSDAKLSLSDLDAIAVSMGPGSYTGLRIGVSTAKGLCYGLDIPLISISTLKAMSFGMALEIKADLYCPMIDARRMEVYSAFFDINNTEVRKIQADIIDENSYKKELEKKVVFFGDGSEKLIEKIKDKNAIFVSDIHPSAKNMGLLSYQKFTKSLFEDLAYFEPFYLKDFVAGRKS
jgi:tRNA threonylcarbamoyladenosine biosynthesis protein TsaB